jgi:hypothetical protein
MAIRVKSDAAERRVVRASVSYQRLVDGQGRVLALWDKREGWNVDLRPTADLLLEPNAGEHLRATFVALDGQTVVKQIKSSSFRLRSSGDLTTAYLDDAFGLTLASSTIDGKWRLLAGAAPIDCVEIAIDNADGSLALAPAGPRSRLSPLAGS